MHICVSARGSTFGRRWCLQLPKPSALLLPPLTGIGILACGAEAPAQCDCSLSPRISSPSCLYTRRRIPKVAKMKICLDNAPLCCSLRVILVTQGRTQLTAPKKEATAQISGSAACSQHKPRCRRDSTESLVAVRPNTTPCHQVLHVRHGRMHGSAPAKACLLQQSHECYLGIDGEWFG